MLANFEKRSYEGKERVWVGRYRNLHNLPHWHLESELIYIERGKTFISHNHQEYSLDSGDAVFFKQPGYPLYQKRRRQYRRNGIV